MQKLIENGRAAYAYEQVKQVCEKENNKTKTEYRALVRSLPSMVQTNGFAAVIAFLYAKRLKNTPHQKVYQTIFHWLKQQGILNSSDKEFIEAVTKQNRDGYKRMTWETMSLLDWLKRFAEGMIEVEPIKRQEAE